MLEITEGLYMDGKDPERAKTVERGESLSSGEVSK
jgi:hypothetical protein